MLWNNRKTEMEEKKEKKQICYKVFEKAIYFMIGIITKPYNKKEKKPDFAAETAAEFFAKTDMRIVMLCIVVIIDNTISYLNEVQLGTSSFMILLLVFIIKSECQIAIIINEQFNIYKMLYIRAILKKLFKFALKSAVLLSVPEISSLIFSCLKFIGIL